MRRKRYKKQIVILCIAVVLGMVSYKLAVNWLELYKQENCEFSYGFEEIINVIFFRDDLKRFCYIDKFSMECVKILLYFFIPSVFCIVMQNADIPASYRQMVAVRAGSRRRTLFQMQRNMFETAIFFPCGFIVSVMTRIYVDFPLIAEEMRSSLKNMLLLCGSRILFFVVLQEVLFLLYLKWGVGISCFIGCLFMIMLLMIDITIEDINFVLYHPENHFIDSLVISVIILCMIRFLEKRSKLRENIRMG